MEITQMPSSYKFPMYPYRNNYSRMLTYKVQMKFDRWAGASGDGRRNVDVILDYVEQVDNLTRGIPKMLILVGFQEGGHDFQYPEWGPVDRKIRSEKHPEMFPEEAMNYLMRTAREKFNTQCTVHVNLVDAYTDSRLWDYYLENDMICKHSNGDLVTAWQHDGRYGYAINMKNAWEKGATKQQIDNLFKTLPEIVKVGHIHPDANCQYRSSPYHGHTSVDMEKAYKSAINYMREQYDVDVSGEFSTDDQYGFVPFGLSWAHEHCVAKNIDPMKIPPYIACGGQVNPRHNMNTLLFGSSVQFELDQYHEDPQTHVLGEFMTDTVPYFFLNSKLRLEFNPYERYALLSDGVKSFIDENDIRNITQGDCVLRIGNDIFVPAIWKEKEIMAYSQDGCERTWKLPSDWAEVGAVDIYELKTSGAELLTANVSVSNRELPLSIAPKQGLSIVPAGTVLSANDIKPTGGTAELVGVDHATGGDWTGFYGNIGYEVFGGESNLNEVSINYIGSEEIELEAWEGALQTAPNSTERAIIGKISPLHHIIDVKTTEKQQVSLYLWDWGSYSRKTIVDAIDPNTQEILAHTIVDDYHLGKYVSFNVDGHVQLRLTTLYDENIARFVRGPLVCGVFVDKIK